MKTTAIIVLFFCCVIINTAYSEEKFSVTRMSNVVKDNGRDCAIFRLIIPIIKDPTRPSISYFYGCKDEKNNVTVKELNLGGLK